MSLALLGDYGRSDDDEEEEALAMPGAATAFADEDEDDDDDDTAPAAGASAADVEMRQAAPDRGGGSLLPSADDLLSGWSPASGAAPPPSRTGQPSSAPQQRVGGHLVPPQVARGKANLSTEDQSDRTASRPAAGAAGRPVAPAPAPAGKSPAASATWRVKEKRKRELGQQAGGKSDWVQDEKRMLRHASANYD